MARKKAAQDLVDQTIAQANEVLNAVAAGDNPSAVRLLRLAKAAQAVENDSLAHFAVVGLLVSTSGVGADTIREVLRHLAEIPDFTEGPKQ